MVAEREQTELRGRRESAVGRDRAAAEICVVSTDRTVFSEAAVAVRMQEDDDDVALRHRDYVKSALRRQYNRIARIAVRPDIGDRDPASGEVRDDLYERCLRDAVEPSRFSQRLRRGCGCPLGSAGAIFARPQYATFRNDGGQFLTVDDFDVPPIPGADDAAIDEFPQ